MSEMAAENEISREDRIIAHFVAGRTAAETAALLGVSTRTIYRATRSPLFSAKLAEARARRLYPLVATAEDAAPNALQRLIDVADDPTAPASARVRAAGAILDTTLKLGERVHVLGRLATLEALVAELREGDAPIASEPPTRISDLMSAFEDRSPPPEEPTDDA